MKIIFFYIFILLITSVISQLTTDDDDKDAAIKRIFTIPETKNVFSGYEEVTKPMESLGALQKCGETSSQNRKLCVPYYMCDGRTNLIVLNGVTDGFGIIDIRFGENSCNHPLDVCCGVPENETKIETSSVYPLQTTTTTQISKFSSCGKRNPNGIDFKITGNSNGEAEYGEFPWMVAILKKNYNPQTDETLAICGGSLITPGAVLTGAHCVYKYKTKELKVRVGEWDTQTEKERLPYQERNVNQIIIHQDFNEKTLYNDFAIIILDEDIIPAENVGTICLPEQNQKINSQHCLASGWGKNIFGKQGQYQVILKKIQLPLVHHDQCEEALRNTRLGKYFHLDDSFICAGGEIGKDTCTGDGGSPLVCLDPRNPNLYIQIGIVAWGIGCGEPDIPGVYGDVRKFRTWIDQQLQTLTINIRSYID